MSDSEEDEPEEELLDEQRFMEDALASVLVVDNLPIIPPSKVDRLSTMLLRLKQWGSKPNNLEMPMDEATGKSKGFAFVSFDSPRDAATAMANAHGHKLDKSHVFAITKMTEFGKIIDTPDTYTEPDVKGFEEKENMREWLTDARGRDQYVMRFGDHPGETQVFAAETMDPSIEVYKREGWSDGLVQWSPLGTYLATFHPQGVAFWGGQSWAKQGRIAHPKPRLLDFSPRETYAVTYSPDERSGLGGVVIWETRTCQMVRHFPDLVNPTSEWPVIKWSHDDKYCARIARDKKGDNAIFVSEMFPSDKREAAAKPMVLLNNKSIKVPDIVDFQWSPTDNIISYWLGENEEDVQPARVCIMQIPSREVLSQSNLFMVHGAEMHWQKSGDYLCVRVERHNRTKKQNYSNFEIFRMREKNIPRESIELHLDVYAFAWEPVGHRFAMITGEQARPDVSFYTMKGAKHRLLKTLEKKSANEIFWAPEGRFCVLAGLGSLNGVLEFWNTEQMEMMGYQEHFMCTNVAWDPTGRLVASHVSCLNQNMPMENGYNFYSFQGTLLSHTLEEKFMQLMWRPRPPSLLTDKDVKGVKKNLRNFTSKFEEEDKKLAGRRSEDERIKRNRIRAEWVAYVKAKAEEVAAEINARRRANGGALDSERDVDCDVTYEEVNEVISLTQEDLGSVDDK